MSEPHWYTKEPVIHSHITDVLPNDHPLANKTVYCDHCKKEMLHCSNNECMQTWVETEFGNYCTACWHLKDVLESLETSLGGEIAWDSNAWDKLRQGYSVVWPDEKRPEGGQA